MIGPIWDNLRHLTYSRGNSNCSNQKNCFEAEDLEIEFILTNV